jgi:hypothetical protein
MIKQLDTRHHQVEMADYYRDTARLALNKGNNTLCDLMLKLAAQYYRAAGQRGMAADCERFIGEEPLA